jgi:hypothetical protein
MVEFNLNSDFGAVLLCEGDVTRRGYDHAEPFRQWIRANASKLLATFPKEIRAHGLYVVLTTYTTQAALMNSWHSQSHKVTLGSKGTADPIGNSQASTEFYGADSANGWTKTVRDGKIRCLPLLLLQLK